MIPFGDPLLAVIGVMLAIGALIWDAIDLVFILLVARNAINRAVAFWAGASSLLTYSAFLAWRLSERDHELGWIVAFFFLPVALGLLLMVVVTLKETRRLFVLALGIAVLITALIGAEWRVFYRWNALDRAVYDRDATTVKRLVASGMLRNEPAARQALLMEAAKECDPATIAILLDAGARADSQALATAATRDEILRYDPRRSLEVFRRDRLASVEALIAHGAKPSPNTMEYLWSEHIDDVLNRLQSHGFRVPDDLPARVKAFVDAAGSGDVSTVKKLADARVLKYAYYTSIEAAVKHNQLEMLDTLRTIHPADGFAYTAAIFAITFNNVEVARRMTALQRYVLCQEQLKRAAEKGEMDIVRLALDAGCDINFKSTGDSVLDCAIKSGRIDLVRELLDRGAKIEDWHPIENPQIRELIAERRR